MRMIPYVDKDGRQIRLVSPKEAEKMVADAKAKWANIRGTTVVQEN